MLSRKIGLDCIINLRKSPCISNSIYAWFIYLVSPSLIYNKINPSQVSPSPKYHKVNLTLVRLFKHFSNPSPIYLKPNRLQ